MNNWIGVGRDGGTGSVAMTGGTWNKTANGAFILGASGPGTFVQSGGVVDVQAGDTWMGESNIGNYTLSGSGEFRAALFQVGRSGNGVGNINLNGGILRANQIIGGAGVENVSFNGTQIIAKQNQTNFIGGMDTAGATIDAGGLLVDSNSFTLTAPQSFDGAGGVIKSGLGTLTLSGANTYTGNHTITGGSLALSTLGSGTGSVSLANGTAFGVNAAFAGDPLSTSAVTFGTNAATTLNVNLGDVAGTNPTNAILDVTGPLTLNGAVTVNVAGIKFAVGNLPLVSYNAASLTGAGSFVLGTKPAGVAGTLQVNPNYFGPGLGAVYLAITSVALPEWNDTVNNVWDTTTQNWIDQVSTLASFYANGNPVLFSDLATGPGGTALTLNTIVNPADVLFTNSTLVYSLTGTGAISGSTGLTKQGTQSLTIASMANTYTGVTRLEGGTTAVGLLTNGGIASSLGAATSSAANLVLAGGTLSYTGAAVTINRGISIAAVDNTVSSGINLASNLTTSGGISATLGKLVKSGPGLLTFTNAGANVLAVGSDGDAVPRSLSLSQGGLVFNGAGQTNSVTGRTAFGSTAGFATNVSLVNGASFTGNGRTLVAESDNSNTTLTVSGTSSLVSTDAFLIALGAGSIGNVIIENSGSINQTGGWLSIGNSNNGVGTLTVRDSGTLTSNADLNVSDVGTSQGTLNIQNSATVTHSGSVYVGKNGGTSGTLNISGGTFNISGGFSIARETGSVGTVNQTGGLINHTGGDFQIGNRATAAWTQSAGTVNANGWTILGRDPGGNGTLSVSGGVFKQTELDRPFMIGEFGIGVLNVSGTAQVSSLGSNGLILANEPSGTGTVHLDGGTLTVSRVRKGNDYNGGNGGTSIFHFNGGTLVAGTGANANFMSGLNSAVVDAGGAYINSNNQTVGISQVLDDGGGNVHKIGAGTLQMNGFSNYLGITFVDAGTLGGTGGISGPLVVAAGASVNPGITAGTFTAGDAANINGTYVCEIDGLNSDKLAVSGALTITAAMLNFNQLAAPTLAVYVIASYGTLSGPFATVTNLPSGYALVYNYLGGNQIALVQSSTPYSLWADSYNLVGTDRDPGFDKDGDGQSNGVEFALGGSPISGSNNAKIYNLVADSSADVDSLNEMLITIAVRTGTPAFAGSPSPAATMDGATYTIQGSMTLSSFTTGATPVNPVVTGLPAAPAGYEYRTFSLNGSNGTPSAGFLRVQVTN